MFISKRLAVALSLVLAAPIGIYQQSVVAQTTPPPVPAETAGAAGATTAAAGTIAGVSVATAIAVGVVGLAVITKAADSGSGEAGETGEALPEEPSPEPEPEPPGEAFSNYKEADFKPPTYDQMATEMAELRAKREKFPELIGKQAFESDLRDEEIEEIWVKVEGVKAQGKESVLPAAFAALGRAVMAAGITDPALDDLREEEQEISDRMLNLQMQLRRMGGGDRVKQPSSWPKWIFILVFALFAVGIIFLVTYQFLGREEQFKLDNWFYNTFGFYSDL